ncbi:MAG: nitroreductase [Methanobacterium sp.]|uniref:nitroreductase family protein n=1 Tax=Methanobacterium sp. TaxID=2164 RepID=UPI003D65D842|nr:nitroreductase [Methanobacterium sp.]
MEDNDLYQVIFKRKSIRKYDLTPLDEDRLKEISDHLQTLEPLHKDIKIEFKILSPDLVKRRMMRKAPHYIAVFSEPKDGYLNNVGFMLQQMDLFFSANGLGSCWYGIPQLKKEGLKSSNLEFIMLMSFGNPQESLHRTNISEFKRKSLQEISDIEGADEILEAARLAPSAGNGQPWFFTGDKNAIHAYSIKPGFVRGLLTKKYPPIDVGISLYHLKLAAEHFGRGTEIVFDKPEMDNLNEYDYVASLRLK